MELYKSFHGIKLATGGSIRNLQLEVFATHPTDNTANRLYYSEATGSVNFMFRDAQGVSKRLEIGKTIMDIEELQAIVEDIRQKSLAADITYGNIQTVRDNVVDMAASVQANSDSVDQALADTLAAKDTTLASEEVVTDLQADTQVRHDDIVNRHSEILSIQSDVDASKAAVSDSELTVLSSEQNVYNNVVYFDSIYANMVTTYNSMVDVQSDVTTKHDTVVTKHNDVVDMHDTVVTLSDDVAIKHADVVSRSNDVTVKHGEVLSKADQVATDTDTVNAAQIDVSDKYASVTAMTDDVTAKHSNVVNKSAVVDVKHADVVARSDEVTTRHNDVIVRSDDVAAKHTEVLTKAQQVSTDTDTVNAAQQDVTAKHTAVTNMTADVTAKHDNVVAKSAVVDTKHADVVTRSNDVVIKHGEVQGWHTQVSGWHDGISVMYSDTVTKHNTVVTLEQSATASKNAAAASATSASNSEANVTDMTTDVTTKHTSVTEMYEEILLASISSQDDRAYMEGVTATYNTETFMVNAADETVTGVKEFTNVIKAPNVIFTAEPVGLVPDTSSIAFRSEGGDGTLSFLDDKAYLRGWLSVPALNSNGKISLSVIPTLDDLEYPIEHVYTTEDVIDLGDMDSSYSDPGGLDPAVPSEVLTVFDGVDFQLMD